MTIPAMRRLPLMGTKNTRDLGGYACRGGVTRPHIFLRSDSTSDLSVTDIEFLRAYGVRNVLDLRGDMERTVSPSALLGVEDIQMFSVPLSDELDPTKAQGIGDAMLGLYFSLLDSSAAQISEIFRIFAHTEGGTLFHCTLGKDRSGVVTMLLLELIGVPWVDIVADYTITATHVRELYRDFDFSKRLTERRSLMGRDTAHPASGRRSHGSGGYIPQSSPENAEALLDYLNEQYQDAEHYLHATGLTEEEIAKIRKKFVVSAGSTCGGK